MAFKTPPLLFAHSVATVHVSFASSHGLDAAHTVYGPSVFDVGAQRHDSVTRLEVAFVTAEQKLFLSHLTSTSFNVVSLSHQLSPVHSASPPQAHVTPAANVFRVVPFFETHAGVGAGVTVYDNSSVGGGESLYVAVTVCVTPEISRTSSTILVTVVVDVHVVSQVAIFASQLVQSLLQ
jgi:hypothetical protein